MLHRIQQAVTEEIDTEAGDRVRQELQRGSQLLKSQGRSRGVLHLPSRALRQLFGGGLPRGRTIEIIGRGSSGRFSAVLAALAGATATGEAAALVDLGDALEPARAATAGVHLEHLLWLRPQHVKDALRAAEALLAAGFALVVIDLGLPPVPGGRGTEGAWRRLAMAARQRGAALLVAAPYRSTGTAAEIIVSLRRHRALWRETGHQNRRLSRSQRATSRLLNGMEGRLVLEKWRLNNPARQRRSQSTQAHPLQAQWLAAERPDAVSLMSCANAAPRPISIASQTLRPTGLAPQHRASKHQQPQTQPSQPAQPQQDPEQPLARPIEFPAADTSNLASRTRPHGGRGSWRRHRLTPPPPRPSPTQAATA